VSVPAFLAQLRGRDIRVWADGERLRCSAPEGLLTPELRDELQRRKRDILEFLRAADSLARRPRALVPLQPHGTRTPVFAAPGHNGDVFCYRALAQHLGTERPWYGLQPPGLDGGDEPLACIEDLAAHFAAQIRALRLQGPCIIAGYCAGGSVAFELARQLAAQNTRVELLALFGAPYPARYRRLPMLIERLVQERDRVTKHLHALARLSAAGRREYLARKLRDRRARLEAAAAGAREPVLARRAQVERATLAAARRYTPGPFSGRVCVFLPNARWVCARDEPLRWRSVAQNVETYAGPEGCNGDNMLREPYAALFADLFRRAAEPGAEADGSTTISGH
jgi:thioesterase domain-containing protein